MKGTGTIIVRLEEVTPEETEYLRNVLRLLFGRGVFNIKGGKAVLHFNGEGYLQAIDIDQPVWRGDKPPRSLYKIYEHAIITME